MLLNICVFFFAFICYFVLPLSVYSCTMFPVFCTHQRSTQFVEGLRYEPEGPEFDSRWGHWDFSLIYPGVESSCNTIEYQGCLLGCKGPATQNAVCRSGLRSLSAAECYILSRLF